MEWPISPEAALSIGINVVYALAIFVVALWLSGFVKRRVVSISRAHPELDETLFAFFASLARYTILIIAIVFVLNRFGIQTTSIVALIGAAGLAIGLALQGTLSHLAAGVMLIVFRPFKVGDFIESSGYMGTVKFISLFNTELATMDNVQVFLPNGLIWSNAVTNYSSYDQRRVELIFGVSYDSDLKVAEQAIRDVIERDKRALAMPEPFVAVTTLNASSVDFMVRVWCARSDFLEFKSDLTRAVKVEFDERGIDIPFPTTTVRRIEG